MEEKEVKIIVNLMKDLIAHNISLPDAIKEVFKLVYNQNENN